MLTNVEIQEIIPHRYPFMMVDKMIELEPGKRGVGIKNVTINEPFFQGHFPGKPVMPGVLLVEALAQTAGITVSSQGEYKGKLGLFAQIEEMKFKNPVVPGDVLRLEVEIIMNKLSVIKAKVRATVEGQVAAEGVVKFVMIDPAK
ncbi:MAG: 3-hydroxyacyl-ACP dehydratase FabZ [Bacillota bacterium]|nr:3-hydroxyacyl-ACP dehydratase FabZ [Bacillota bacterium]